MDEICRGCTCRDCLRRMPQGYDDCYNCELCIDGDLSIADKGCMRKEHVQRD
jgi:hypothetical protein